MAVTGSALDAFLTTRPRLFGIAYRMTGSVTEAEDLVQEAWLRWQSTDPSTVLNSAAFLATITTRLAINHLQSASQRRESYIGPWLPEPVDTSNDPHLGAERKQALSLAILHLLESLNPAERAAYILREAFAYSHQQIASVIETTEANARQLYARASKHIQSRPHHSVPPEAHRHLLSAFIKAAQAGDTAALEKLLASDATSITDGNGMLGAARVPVTGRERVARLITAYFAKGFKDVEMSLIEANGEPALLATLNGKRVAVAIFNLSPEGIESLYWIMSPPKLTQFLLDSMVDTGSEKQTQSPYQKS